MVVRWRLRERIFEGAELGNRRRTQRLVHSVARIVQRPGGTLPDKLKAPAELKGLYRLMNADSVTHAAVLEPHRQRTLARMRACEGDVLVIHDTTELDYTGKQSLRAIGQIGNGGQRGDLCHNSLAVVAGTRAVLGPASQILHIRPQAPKGQSRSQARRKSERESRLWKRGSEAVGPPPADCRWIEVSDRAADLFEYLDHQHAVGGSYVVRNQHDRRPRSATTPATTCDSRVHSVVPGRVDFAHFI